jgi:hypothetical protein
MKLKRVALTTIILIASFCIFGTKTQADIFDDIAVAFRSGNYKGVAKHFSTRVELKLDNKENVYSKTQAELIMKDFFEKNPPTNFRMNHKGTSAKGLTYVIGTLTTSNGDFRITFYFKRETDDKLYIHRLQFEKD